MNRSPIFTIVLPARNRGTLISRTLDSIASQSLRPLKLILVDNASDDETLAVATKWAERHRADNFDITILTEPTPGASRARNKGLASVTTPYVLFFDSDDQMEHDHLERVDTALRANPEINILHWDISYRDSDGWTTVKQAETDNSDRLSEQILHSILATARYCCRTELLRKAGEWDTSLTTWDDYELGIRLLLQHPTVRYLQGTPRVIANCSDNSLTGPTFSSRALAQRTAIEHIEALLQDSPEYLLLFRAKCAVLAANYCREGSSELGRETLSRAIAPYCGKTAAKLKVIHLVQRIAGRGASSLAAKLFAPAVEQNG